MKSKFLTGFFGTISLFLLALPVYSQLAGTHRIVENQWMANDRKVQFGAYPNAEIYYDGTDLVIDVVHGGGKVKFPDGLDLGTSNQTLGSSLVFEGATNDASETTLSVTDPTADRTIMLPNASGAVILSTAGVADTASAVWGASNGLVFEGATADAFETSLTVTDPTADRTVTLPDASGTVLLTNGAMSGGTVNGSVIGGVTPAAGTFTTLSATTSIDLLTLTQAKLTSTCTTGQLRLDTGGSTGELCYCRATNTFACTAMASGPTD